MALALAALTAGGCCNHPLQMRANATVRTLTPHDNTAPPIESRTLPHASDPCAAAKVALIDVDGILVNRNVSGPYSMGENPVALFREKLDVAAAEGVVHLLRTHPLVQGLADHTFDTALDPHAEGIAHRAGVVRTGAVAERTVLLLVRMRFHLVVERAGAEHDLLAEDCLLYGFTGAPDAPEWLAEDEALRLLDAAPSGNVAPDLASHHISRMLDHGPTLIVDSMIGVKCAGAPAPRDTIEHHFVLTAPAARTLQIPAAVCYDYVTYVTAPGIGYVGPYDWSTFSPLAGDTVVMHLYDPI